MGMFKKALNAVSPVASVINKSGPIASILGMKKKGSTGGGGLGLENLVKQAQTQNALQEGQARVAPVKAAGMKKGGKVKGSSSSASKRADGCATKGKTRGRMI
jgi:hypothetical protein